MNKRQVAGCFVLNLEKQRLSMGLTQGQMAKRLSMSLSGYKKLVAGDTVGVNLYLAYRLHEMTGKCVMEGIDCEDEETRLLGGYRALSRSQRAFISDLVRLERVFQLNNPEGERDYISVCVPTGDFADGMIYDSCSVEKVNAAAYRARFGEALSYGLKITTTHMHPVYLPGDILLICRRPVRDGDTGLFLNKETGRLYVRRFRQTEPCRLESVNGLGETIYIDASSPEEMEKWIRCGCVLSKMRGNGI